MNINDIVNREIVNLTNCEQEPIHIPGSIQEHGFLIGIHNNIHLVNFCSENIYGFTGIKHSEAIGKSFIDLFGADEYDSLLLFMAEERFSASHLHRLHIEGKVFNCSIHLSNETIIIEAEPEEVKPRPLYDVYAQTRQFLYYLEAPSTLQELCMRVAENIREITGYDRVMIYRFDDQYNGEVFAESVGDSFEPFMGLHYPHTDIPPQARELYLKNLVRLIPDISYSPVAIFTNGNGTNASLDLSFSVLRSVSPIHIQYLQNMGVGATLTISLLHEKKLWGLVACHHYSAKNIPYEVKIAAQLQGHFITSQIDTRKQNEEYDLTRRCNEAVLKAMAFYESEGFYALKELVNQKFVLQICNASGVAIKIENEVFTGGTTPAEKTILDIAEKIKEDRIQTIFSTEAAASDFPFLQISPDECAGLLFDFLTADKQSWIMWFRKQTISEINWAGDPSKAIVKDEKGLSPRNSFALWKEVVRGKSLPWLEPEIKSAFQYINTLQKRINLHLKTEEGRRYRELSEMLQSANDELENINWISTHDLQEPIRKIMMFSSHLLEVEPEDENNLGHKTIKKISLAAERMQNLLQDILKYTRLKNTNEAKELVGLNELIDSIIPDFKEVIDQKNGQVEIGTLPSIEGIPFLVKQVFANLLYNSFKFSSPERPPHIRIRYNGRVSGIKEDQPEKVFHHIQFSDNGIGFEPRYEETIFKIFTRLHNYSEYQGSGIGLALCAKIMQKHDGFIRANGYPGQGAGFDMYFPA
jgi:chemotaxis family two-component system sensor kinase Cph1